MAMNMQIAMGLKENFGKESKIVALGAAELIGIYDPGKEKEMKFEYIFPESGYYKITTGDLTQNVYVWNAPDRFVCKGLKVSAPSKSSKGEMFVTAG